MLPFLCCGGICWRNVVQTSRSSILAFLLGSLVVTHPVLLCHPHCGGNLCGPQDSLCGFVPTPFLYSSGRASCCMPPWGLWGTYPPPYFFNQFHVKRLIGWICSHEKWYCHVLFFCPFLGHWQLQGGTCLEHFCFIICCDIKFCLCGYWIIPDNCIHLLVDWTLKFYLLKVLHSVKVVLFFVLQR